MKFNRTEAEMELYALLSSLSINIIETRYPQLHKMAKRGLRASWKPKTNSITGSNK